MGGAAITSDEGVRESSRGLRRHEQGGFRMSFPQTPVRPESHKILARPGKPDSTNIYMLTI
jgi:hypothetical protein